MHITSVTFTKVGLFIGVLAGISSLIGLINIFFLNNNYSYIAIGLGIFSCLFLLTNYFKKTK